MMSIKRIPIQLTKNQWEEIYKAVLSLKDTILATSQDSSLDSMFYSILDTIGVDGRKAWDVGTQGCALIPEGISQVKRQYLRELLWPYLMKDGAAEDKRQTGRGTKTFPGLINCIESIIFEEE